MMQGLCEKYRPARFEEVVGQPKVCSMIRGVIQRTGAGGKAFFLTGPTGTGKTTLARIIARELAPDVRVHEFRSPEELTASELDDIDRLYHLNRRGLFQTPTAIIVNEAHGLNARQVRALLGLLEPVPPSVVWIFTTTWDGANWLEDQQMDAAPLLARCVSGEPIRLTNQGLSQAFALRALEVARAEGLGSGELPVYVKLAQKCKNSLRAMLQAVEAGAMVGE